MIRRSLERAFTLALVALGALGVGCADKTVPFHVQLVTTSCDGPFPLEGVANLRFRVTGPGIDKPIEAVTPPSAGEQVLPNIPAGTARVLEVRGYDGDPATGKVISLGRSLPFDVPDTAPGSTQAAQEITVFLRRVNSFTPPSLSVSPQTCQRLQTPRAGHTATLMRDGRVFIAGGYQIASGKDNTLSSAEIFNPATGSFDAAKEMGVTNGAGGFTPTPRAFHGAALEEGGDILIVGGEQTSGTSLFATKTALFYNDDSQAYGAFELRQARIAPGIAKDDGGRFLFVGGFDTSGQPVQNPEWFDPNTPAGSANPQLLSDTAPRIGASVAALQGGKYIAVAGGTDGSRLLEEILFFTFDGHGFVATAGSVPLRTGRRSAGAALIESTNKLLLVGGFASAAEDAQALASTEILATGDAFQVSQGPQVTEARGDVCTVGLDDGRVLTLGGRTASGASARASAAAELTVPSDTGPAQVIGLTPLPTGRYFHTCTKLLDGSVLVTGGIADAGGQPQALDEALIFTPEPID